MDKQEKKLKILRAYEINFGEFNRAWNNIISDFDSCTTIKDVRHAYKCGLDTLTKIPIKNVPENDKIRVGIVGEIYVIMERSVNKNIEETLNTLGVEVENVQYTSDWVRDHLTPQWFPYPKVHRVAKLSDEVSPLNTGGHEKHNMGWIFDFKKRGFDGVVHLMPFACLPELVNLGKFPAISKELDMPILSLSLDEQLGEAHIKTRVEAFTDLIRSKHFMIEPVIQKPDDGAVKKPRVLVPEGEMSYAIKNAAKL
ncbi:MAG: hypothetical protein RSC29_03425 [Oscillospiraceae bacterium]